MPGPGRGGRIPCWATSAFVTFNYGGADRVADGPEDRELKETMEPLSSGTIKVPLSHVRLLYNQTFGRSSYSRKLLLFLLFGVLLLFLFSPRPCGPLVGLLIQNDPISITCIIIICIIGSIFSIVIRCI